VTTRKKTPTRQRHLKGSLVHLPNELVDVGLPVSEVTALNVVLEFPYSPATSGVGELEWPEEVGRLLEIRTGGEDFVNKIFNRDDVVLAERLLNHTVVREGDTLLVDLAVAAFIDKLADSLQVWLAIGDIWLHQAQHLFGSLSDLDENTIIDLQ